MDAFVTASFTYPPEPPNIPPEMRGRLLFVLHDAMTEHYNYTTRWIGGGALGTPATCKAADTESERMTEAYQKLWYAALQHFAPGRDDAAGKKTWGGLTHSAKAFCNKTGTDILADYIRRQNLDQEPARQEHIVCTGNTLIASGTFRNIGGQGCTGVLALDRDALPTFDELIVHPAARQFLTAATVTLKVDTDAALAPSTVMIPVSPWSNKVIDPFPDNQYYAGQYTPVPFAAGSGDRVDFMGLKCRVKFLRDNRLVKLPDEEYPISPFVPRG